MMEIVLFSPAEKFLLNSYSLFNFNQLRSVFQPLGVTIAVGFELMLMSAILLR